MSDLLSQMTLPQLGRLFPIKLVAFREAWKGMYEAERLRLIEWLGGPSIRRIEHYGSTAIPRILSKPTIDLLIHISDDLTESRLKEILLPRGYRFMTAQTEHLMFVKGYHPWGYEETCYHLHFVHDADHPLWDGLVFRDYLIKNPDVAATYAELKQKLAHRYRHDREGYTEGKGDFIREVLARAKADHQP